MTDQTIVLGGRTFAIPPLPWRETKEIEPTLIDIWQNPSRPADTFQLSRDELETLAGCVFRALQYARNGVEEAPKITREEFEDLPFNIADLMAAVPVLARACGLRAVDSGESDPGKPTGTSSSSMPAHPQAGQPRKSSPR